MKIGVTGGGGFLGREVVRQLLEKQYEVVSVSRGDYPDLLDLGASQFRGDLAEPSTSLEAFEDCGAIIHCAAKAGIWGKPSDFERSNIKATRNVIDACLKLGIPKLVFTSSPSVTFDGHDEENAPQALPYPRNFLANYPRTKAIAERFVLQANSPELATVALRPHLIWGKGDPHLVVRLLERQSVGKLKIVGNGKNRVDMTHVVNAAYAHILALEQLTPTATMAGKPYFISDAKPVLMWDWLNKLFHDVGLPPLKSRLPATAAYIAGSFAETIWRLLNKEGEPPMTRFVAKQLSTSHWYDIIPAKEDLGYQPIVNYDEAYAEMIDWIRNDITQLKSESTVKEPVEYMS